MSGAQRFKGAALGGAPAGGAPAGPRRLVGAIAMALALVTVAAAAAPSAAAVFGRSSSGATAARTPVSTPTRASAHKVANRPPKPNFLADGSCRGPNDDSPRCDAGILKAIAYARSIEGRKPMHFSLKAYLRLSLDQRIFAAVNLERVERGIAPLAALTRQLDTLAYRGAAAGGDPSYSGRLDGGGQVVAWGGNWAAGFVNSLASDYGWMYWDGPGGPNGDCPKAGASGCYGHRHNILRRWSSTGTCPTGEASRLLLGVGDDTKGVRLGSATVAPSVTELFVHACGPMPHDVVASWARVRKLIGA